MSRHFKSHILVVLRQSHKLTRNIISISVVLVCKSKAGYLHVNHLKLEEQVLSERVVTAELDRIFPVDSDLASDHGVATLDILLVKIRRILLNLLS